MAFPNKNVHISHSGILAGREGGGESPVPGRGPLVVLTPAVPWRDNGSGGPCFGCPSLLSYNRDEGRKEGPFCPELRTEGLLLQLVYVLKDLSVGTCMSKVCHDRYMLGCTMV